MCSTKKRATWLSAMPGVGGQVGIDLSDAIGNQSLAPGASRPSRYSRRRGCPGARPSCPRLRKSILTKAQTLSLRCPKHTASLMCEKNLSLFSMYLGANIAPLATLPTSLARSMIFRWPLASNHARIAGHEVAARHRAPRRWHRGACSTPSSTDTAFEQDFAVVGHLDRPRRAAGWPTLLILTWPSRYRHT